MPPTLFTPLWRLTHPKGDGDLCVLLLLVRRVFEFIRRIPSYRSDYFLGVNECRPAMTHGKSRQKKRERERETDRQTDRQTETERDRDKQIDRQTERDRDRDRERGERQRGEKQAVKILERPLARTRKGNG